MTESKSVFAWGRGDGGIAQRGIKNTLDLVEMLYLNCGGFMGIYICQNSSNDTHEMGVLYCT